MRYSLLREVSALQGCSAEKSAETLTLFRNKVVKLLSRDFLSYDPETKHDRDVKGAIMLIDRLDAFVLTWVRCLKKKKKRGGDHLEEYAVTHGRVMDTVTAQLIGNGKDFKNHRSCEEVTVD